MTEELLSTGTYFYLHLLHFTSHFTQETNAHRLSFTIIAHNNFVIRRDVAKANCFVRAGF